MITAGATREANMKFLAAAIALILGVSNLGAGQPITIGEVVKIPSRILGEERTLLISTPANYTNSSERYPVLYLTDGDPNLLHTRGTVDFLTRVGQMPDVIIVGIRNTDRTRDLTPSPLFLTQKDGTRVADPRTGGAGRFLDFFEKELFPYIDASYRTMPYRIFAGHSFGGSLALHALVTRPELFNAFIAASPALGWDNEYTLRSTADFLKGRKELRRTLFVSMGNEVVGLARPNPFERLCRTLAGTKADGFAWDSKFMPEEDHGSVVLRTHYWGLRKIFEGYRLVGDSKAGPFEGNLADLQEHYLKFSKRQNQTFPPSEALVNQVAYQALGEKDFKRAIPIFNYNIELYPTSANAHDSLGEALERASRFTEALASYEKAVQMGEKQRHPNLGIYIRNRDRVRRALLVEKKTP